MTKEALNIWPITIVADRYGGCYSGGRFTAWNEYDPPEEIFESDVPCGFFWQYNKIIVGLGNTPNDALEDLYNKLNTE